MALIGENGTHWGDSNLVVDTDLVVSYSTRRITGRWSWVEEGSVTITRSEAWEGTRHAVKSFRYVGMTRDEAQDCAKAAKELFTRDTLCSVFDTGSGSTTYGTWTEEDGGSQLMAEIAIQHDEGGMYSVCISVNEVDTRMDFLKSAVGKAAFWHEDAREYDMENDD